MISDKDVTRVVAAATVKQSQDEYVKKYLTGMDGILRKDPKRYLHFGRYWWSLKLLMREAGSDWIDDHVDGEQIDKMSTMSRAEVCAASWIKEDRAINGFELPTSKSIEADGEYELYDHHMESLVAISSR